MIPLCIRSRKITRHILALDNLCIIDPKIQFSWGFKIDTREFIFQWYSSVVQIEKGERLNPFNEELIKINM